MINTGNIFKKMLNLEIDSIIVLSIPSETTTYQLIISMNFRWNLFLSGESSQDEWFSFFVQMFWTGKLKFLWELCHSFPGSILSKLQKYFVAQRQMFLFDI